MKFNFHIGRTPKRVAAIGMPKNAAAVEVSPQSDPMNEQLQILNYYTPAPRGPSLAKRLAESFRVGATAFALTVAIASFVLTVIIAASAIADWFSRGR